MHVLLNSEKFQYYDANHNNMMIFMKLNLQLQTFLSIVS